MDDFKELAIKVIIAALCNGLLGVERQLAGKPVGINTSVLVSIGTVLFCHMTIRMSTESAEHIRILGQIITGIGFLGAGVMLASNGRVLGVTSAAMIWIMAAMGAAVGFGFYFYGILISVLTFCILFVISRVERSMTVLQTGVHHGRVNGEDTPPRSRSNSNPN